MKDKIISFVARWFYTLVLVTMLSSAAIYNYATVEYKTFTVNSKEVKVDYSGENPESTYMVFTNDGVYTNKDSWFFLKFSSSDMYGDLKEGEVYTCKTNKLRIPFFSMYKNIIKCNQGE